MRTKIFLSGLAFWLMSTVLAIAPTGNFDWEEGKELYPGIRHFSIVLAGASNLAVNVIQVDTSTPGLYFYTTPADPKKGEPMPQYPQYTIATRRQTSRQYLEQARRPEAAGGYGQEMVLSVNASPWTPWEEPYTHEYAEQFGLAVAQDNVVSVTGKTVPALVIRQNGSPDIRVLSPQDNLDDFHIVVSGFTQNLTDGVITGDETLHPRTLFGVSEDRQYVYFLVIDGRQKGYSDGIGTKEAAQWLKYFGAWNGVNMDGGGSTQLAVYDAEAATTKLLNHPPDNTERAVANNVGICYTAPQP